MTRHQFLLRARLHGAPRLRRSEEPISAIAFVSGFDDLSKFSCGFRRIMRASPGAYPARSTPTEPTA